MLSIIAMLKNCRVPSSAKKYLLEAFVKFSVKYNWQMGKLFAAVLLKNNLNLSIATAPVTSGVDIPRYMSGFC